MFDSIGLSEADSAWYTIYQPQLAKFSLSATQRPVTMTTLSSFVWEHLRKSIERCWVSLLLSLSLSFFPPLSSSRRHDCTTTPCHSLPISLSGHVGSGSQTKPAVGTAQGCTSGRRETILTEKNRKLHLSRSERTKTHSKKLSYILTQKCLIPLIKLKCFR